MDKFQKPSNSECYTAPPEALKSTEELTIAQPFKTNVSLKPPNVEKKTKPVNTHRMQDRKK
jgi:hypothetical protein